MNYKCGHKIADYRPPAFWATIDCPGCKDLADLRKDVNDEAFEVPPGFAGTEHCPVAATKYRIRARRNGDTEYARAVTCSCGNVYRQLGHYRHSVRLATSADEEFYNSDLGTGGYVHNRGIIWHNWCGR